LRKFKLVIIEWIDAQSDCAWSSIKENEQWTKEDCIIVEVGWIVKETSKYVVIGSQIGNDGEFGNRTKIPRGWIKTIKRLTVAEPEPKK